MGENGGELQITVVTTGNEAASFTAELQMVKAAVLYADKVTLVTPTHTKVSHQLKEMAPGILLAQILALDDSPDWEEAIGAYHRLIAGYRSESDIALFHAHRDSVGVMVSMLNEWIQREWEEAGGDVLVLGAKEGVLELEPVTAKANTDYLLEEAAIDRAAEVFRAAAESSEPSYPLLHWWDWMLVTSRGVTPPKSVPQTEIAIAERILGNLECFPDAPMDELLDLRRRLAAPLVRFRAALAGFARNMEDPGFGSDLDRELHTLYRREIAPALLELDEMMEDLGAKASLRRAGAAAVKSLGIAMAELLVFSEVFASAVTPIGSAAGAEIKHRLDARTARRANDFLFVWEVETRLRQA